jgi:hypothetical protein
MRHGLESIGSRLPICICCVTASLAAISVTTAGAAGTESGPRARAAGRVALVEVGHLTLSKEEGSAIIEHGKATGTYDAPIAAAFTTHPKSVTVLVTIYPKGGSITGVADANYTVVKDIGYFGGSFTIEHGTGKYRHVSEVDGKALGFSGTINRTTFAAEVKVNRGEIDL